MRVEHDRERLRHRLRQEIRKYRCTAGMTQRDVAKAMDWSLSKVNRIESGAVTVSTNDLRAMLSCFGIDEARVVRELVTLARVSKRPPWSEDQGSARAAETAYFAQEASASMIRQYEPTLVPGLLQTEEYTRAVVADARLHEGPQLELVVRARLERRQVLERAKPPRMFFILDEAVLHRQVGGWETMPQQLEHLAELGSRRGISIQIVPFARGAYAGLLGPFVLLDTSEDGSRLYLEGRGDTVVTDDVEETSSYLDHFQRLEHKLATDPDHLREAIDNLTS